MALSCKTDECLCLGDGTSDPPWDIKCQVSLTKNRKKQGYEYFIVILTKNSDKNRELTTLRLSFTLYLAIGNIQGNCGVLQMAISEWHERRNFPLFGKLIHPKRNGTSSYPGN